jgi:hypothetical protein
MHWRHAHTQYRPISREGRGFEPPRSPAYTNRYTNLGVIWRNTAIRCERVSPVGKRLFGLGKGAQI